MEVYQKITDRIIQLLEQGDVPWRKPWSGGPAAHPKNLNTGKPYRGINVFMLHAAGYESPWWLTFKQARGRGGHVRKGEKGWPVVFWKFHEVGSTDDDGKATTKAIPLLRQYTVFNVDQCDDIEAPAAPGVKTFDFDPIASAEGVVANMPKRPTIGHGENRAYYRPSTDAVNMPKPERFSLPTEYYSTLFHELTHATGHTSRLDRKLDTRLAAFGTADYSREELVAEMGAAFLCGHAGIDQTLDNSAAYIGGWLKRLRNDKRLVVTAAAQAQKAADFILGTEPAPKGPTSDEPAPEQPAPKPTTLNFVCGTEVAVSRIVSTSRCSQLDHHESIYLAYPVDGSEPFEFVWTDVVEGGAA